MNTPLIGILHPVVITPDLDRALRFYRDLLGFAAQPVMDHDPARIARLGGPPDTVAQAVILRAADGSELEIASFTRPEGLARSAAGWADAGIRSITFKVSDMGAMLQRLASGGYPLVKEVVRFTVDGAGVDVAYVQGPDGVVLTLLAKA